MTPCCHDCGAVTWHESCPACEQRDSRDRCERLAALYFEPDEAGELLEWALHELRTWHDVETELECHKCRAELLARWQMETA